MYAFLKERKKKGRKEKERKKERKQIGFRQDGNGVLCFLIG